MIMHRIDINCDLGEGFGVYQIGHDEQIFPLISSANIACGFHAGDPVIMQRSVELALQYQVSIGVHPGTSDLAGFGRRSMALSEKEVEALLIYQVGALDAFARANGAVVHHVKPHGWLYNEAAGNPSLARVIVSTIKRVSPNLVFFGLSGSMLEQAALKEGLQFAREGFIDRAYRTDGSLVPRSQPMALITDPEKAATQALRLVLEKKVQSVDGADVAVEIDTLCVHGDNPQVVEILRTVHEQFEKHGVTITSVETQ
jgi:UPF0271 protein